MTGTTIQTPPKDYKTRALSSLEKLPAFSPILNRLMATLADENVSFAQLAALIEKDTVLAGHVLKLVNSAAYGRRGTINSVTHALSILGLQKLRNLALSFSVSRMWSKVRTPPDWSVVRFNLHAVSTAMLADSVAQRLTVVYPEGAFIAGLLHDIGKLLIAVGMHKEYAVVQQLSASGGRTIEECEKEAIGATHAELSAIALARWNLPAPVQQAVEFHHAPEQCPPPDAEGLVPLAHLIHASSEVANRLDISIAPAAGPQDNPCEPLHQLGLEAQAAALVEGFQTEFGLIRKLF